MTSGRQLKHPVVETTGVECLRHFWHHIGMKIGAFEINEPVPELRDPHVFAMVRPWVDVGSVGTLTLNRLERYLGSKELGKLQRPGVYFDFTRYRPTMRLVDGERQVTIPNSIIRYAKTEEGPDYLFFHLLEPHSNSEEYTDSLLEMVNHFQVKRYCRIGAMYDAVPHTRPLLITGALGDVKQNRQVPSFRTRKSTYQGPTTIMNLLSEGIDKSEIESINFMVHIPQYAQLEEDYAGASPDDRSPVFSVRDYSNGPGAHAPGGAPVSGAQRQLGTELGTQRTGPANGSLLRRADGLRRFQG